MADQFRATLDDLLLRVAVEGTTMVLSFLAKRAVKVAKHQAALEKFFADDDAALRALDRVWETVAAETASGLIDRGALEAFLKAPETGAVVRQAFAVSLVGQRDRHLENLRKEFSVLLALHLDLPEQGVADVADAILDVLLLACEQSLQEAVADGTLSAHEAKSCARTNLILDELANISRALESLPSSKATIADYLEFDDAYRHQVGSRHAHLIPPHLDTARKVSISRLYVPPRFASDSSDPDAEPLTASDILPTLYRAVVLGNPGGGKSTFVQKLTHDLATKYDKRVFGGRALSPVLITLRDYGAEKKHRPCSILEFVEQTAASKYQVQAPAGAFEYLLTSGRLLVIFDGLDELLDTSYRLEITGDVESFCNLYPAVPCVVTSREVGYDQAPLDPEAFTTYRLESFGDGQVEAYARKWFSVAESHLPATERRQKADAFVKESQLVPDLRSNPLMLALMCNIFRGESYIPKNRPDLYAKCATMLFERWDKGRGILVTLPFEERLRPTMHYLAYWIYQSEELQSGVSEKQLVAASTDYLYPRRFEDRDEANAAAQKFVEFCRGRAWVFTDTGTTEAGDRLYQFTHRTFLEYFTAEYLVRNHHVTAELAHILLPRIEQSEWDVVAQLAFQLQSGIEGALDELLDGLLQRAAAREGQARGNLLSFAARSLQYTVPSPRVVRDTVDSVLRHLVENAVSGHRSQGPRSSFDRDVITDLLAGGKEVWQTMRDQVVSTLGELTEQGGDAGAASLDVALSLSTASSFTEKHDEWTEWRQVSNEFHADHRAALVAFARTDWGLAAEAWRRDDITMSELLEFHGLARIFEVHPLRVFGILRAPVAFTLLTLSVHGRELSRRISDDLATIGRRFLQNGSDFPLARPLHGFGPMHRGMLLDPTNSRMAPDALFGVLAIFAVSQETDLTRLRFPGRSGPLGDISLLLAFHQDGTASGDRLEDALDRLRFTPEQRLWTRTWLKGGLVLVDERSGHRRRARSAQSADSTE